MRSVKYLAIVSLCIFFAMPPSTAADTTRLNAKTGLMPAETSADISLPAGFKAVSVVDSIGRARHLVVSQNGDIYVKLERLKNGKGVYRLKDTNGDGRADNVSGFGNYIGTGIVIKNGYLYASSNTSIYRYKLNEKNEISDTGKAEMIVTGLIDRRQHESKSITLDNAGNIYVNIGAFSNSCQVMDRANGSPGQDPCPILDSAGGIWQFKSDKLNQSYADGVRYATGIRNVVGLDWNNTVNELFVMQHGRDGLNTMFPALYTAEQSAELPSEEMLMVKKGSNFGWPYCYYDGFQKKKILAPEYGGDTKQQGRCSGVDTPVMAFPGHWAPNALLFYTGNMFPAKYKNGAFIAFHGSWNRAPLKQGGYFVAFVPFKDGKPSGAYEVFAEGFAGKDVFNPRDAEHRPCGLAQGPDGSLYISDDVKGKIWKIGFNAK
ncbi:MAG: PQQ-dependent sugar dehydrogenase [Chitinophagaceae bacterium]